MFWLLSWCERVTELPRGTRLGPFTPVKCKNGSKLSESKISDPESRCCDHVTHQLLMYYHWLLCRLEANKTADEVCAVYWSDMLQSTHLPLWQWVRPLQASYPTLVPVCGSASIRGVQGDSVRERERERVLAFLWASLVQQQSCTVHSPALKNQTSSEVRHKRVKKAVPANFIYLTTGINISEPECGVCLVSSFPFTDLLCLPPKLSAVLHWLYVFISHHKHKSSTTKHVKCYKSYKSSKSVRNLELKLVPSRAALTGVETVIDTQPWSDFQMWIYNAWSDWLPGYWLNQCRSHTCGFFTNSFCFSHKVKRGKTFMRSFSRI